jgi:hypothetical protein
MIILISLLFGLYIGYGSQYKKIINLKKEITSIKKENIELIKQLSYINNDYSDYSE